MVWHYGEEDRIDMDINELEALEEHGQLLFPIPERDRDIRLVLHEKDYSEEVEKRDDRAGDNRTFG